MGDISVSSGRVRGGRDPLGSSRPGNHGRAEVISESRAIAERVAAERRERVRREVAAICLPGNARRVRTLEIGCGHGHFLTAFAAQHPECECLGLDYSRGRIERAKRKVVANNLGNAHFLHASSGDFLATRPAMYRFHQVYVLFPDPWPKRKHRKYRLINPEFLTELAGAVEQGGALYFRTDFQDYFCETRTTLGAHKHWEIEPDAVWPFDHTTVFESKAKRFFSLKAVRSGPTR